MYEANLNTYYFGWEHSGGSPANGKVDYPVNFVAFRLDAADQRAGAGTIYLDDLVSSEGPDATVVQFGRSDGQVVSVVWSSNAAQVSIPSRTNMPRSSRDGAARTLDLRDGNLTLQAGISPTYITHSPADPPKQASASVNLAQPNSSSACGALTRAETLPGGRYFARPGIT